MLKDICLKFQVGKRTPKQTIQVKLLLEVWSSEQVKAYIAPGLFLTHINSPETSLAVGKTDNAIGKKHFETT